ncbi:hypothetical protein [Capnocytophaga canimorsus]|uniref:hypothetical protein n=1 Tax=Capnocytophaga canimorsus TaxID=28188 RepID=UPI0012FFA304|nr:hypothetical protein [Capnocytophaga canimorsus]
MYNPSDFADLLTPYWTVLPTSPNLHQAQFSGISKGISSEMFLAVPSAKCSVYFR